MSLTRAQLLSGNSSQGIVLPGQVQAIRQGPGVFISPNGTISIDATTIVGLMRMGQTRESAAKAYNSFEWPDSAPTNVGDQLTITGISGNVTTLGWSEPLGILWTQKGQLAVGTGVNTYSLLPVASQDGSILSSDSSAATGLAYTSNYVATTGSTGAALLPVGTTAEQPSASTTVGGVRYSSSLGCLEFSNGTSWLQLTQVNNASLTQPGIVQLTNDYTGTSQTITITQYAASLLNAKINSITGGNVLAGTYDSATGVVATTTSAGAAAGFVVGSQAPAATSALDNYYLLVTSGGNLGPPGATIPGTGVQSGDWFIVQDDGSGASWTTIDFQNSVVTASQVSLAPITGLSASNVQQGIQELTNRTGSTLTAISSTNSGITVATSAAAPFGQQSTLTLNPPTATTIGGVKAGTNITIAPDGTISSTGGGGGGGAVSSVSGTGGITVSPSTGAVIVNGSNLLPLAGGTMLGPLITASGSQSAPSLGIGSATAGFYNSITGTAYTPSSTTGVGTTLIINGGGQLLIGRSTDITSKSYGGGFLQVFGDETFTSGGGALVVGQFGGSAQSAITLMGGNGTVASPSPLSTGTIGILQWADPISTTNISPQPRAVLGAYKTGNGDQTDIYIAPSDPSGTPSPTWQWQGGAYRPWVDNSQVLGTTTYRPQYLCAVSGVINTSDPSQKKNITPLEEGYGLDYIKALNPVTYQWITEYNEVEADPEDPYNPEKATINPVPGTITHIGFLADEVSSTLDAAGSLEPHQNGLVGQNKHLPPKLKLGADADNLEQYWINHSQMIPCLVKSVQQLSNALETLQAQFDAYVATHP